MRGSGFFIAWVYCVVVLYSTGLAGCAPIPAETKPTLLRAATPSPVKVSTAVPVSTNTPVILTATPTVDSNATRIRNYSNTLVSPEFTLTIGLDKNEYRVDERAILSVRLENISGRTIFINDRLGVATESTVGDLLVAVTPHQDSKFDNVFTEYIGTYIPPTYRLMNPNEAINRKYPVYLTTLAHPIILEAGSYSLALTYVNIDLHGKNDGAWQGVVRSNSVEFTIIE